MLKISDIRNSYLEYFKSNHHLILPSSSLLPDSDPSLLFTTAGMVPFKNYFAGIIKPPSERIATVQKCFRTTDLEEVGKTKRHLSMFEMLGNFSFGNYFKKEAIEFAWEYVTTFLPFNKEEIWISIFENDDEAFQIWNKHIGIPSKRIVRLGKKDNFWGPAGSTGACGPCSELYLDRGIEFDGGHGAKQPGDEGDRFMEFWNLVFNQFDLDKDGNYLPLAQTGIDTGAGLERLATLVQNVDSVFDTDELSLLRNKVSELYNTSYSGENIVPIRVVTDHIKALTFTMADGIYPSNESRGYVLRRVLRRALLFSRKMGQKNPMMYKLVSNVVDIYGSFYNEIVDSKSQIEKYIESEEKRFLQTLDDGYSRLLEIMNRAHEGAYKGNIISGKDVFNLYDTFGFPPEMTKEMAENEGFSINFAEFETEMESQRSKGKAAWRGDASRLMLSVQGESRFVGYDLLNVKTKIEKIIIDNEENEEISDKSFPDDNQFIVLTEETPCYAESGGQLGDQGKIKNSDFSCDIVDTQKQGNLIYHICSNLKGTIKLNDNVEIAVDLNRRDELKKNHTATHILNSALRKNLGAHIKQSGSLVHPDYLRFDFTHPDRLTKEQVDIIEIEVNNVIQEKCNVGTKILPIEEARKSGAVMNFGEKYGDIVRVVSVDDFSVEFCGGTHVKNSEEIKLFIIIKESSPGAGNRRIEAISSDKAIDYVEKKFAEIQNIIREFQKNGSIDLRVELESIHKKTEQIIAINDYLEKWQILKKIELSLDDYEQKNRKLQKKKDYSIEVDSSIIEELLASQMKKNNLNIATGHYEGSIPFLKVIADEIRKRESQLVLLLTSVEKDRWNCVVATTSSYAQKNKLNLSEILKDAIKNSRELNGNGGGKVELAQASGIMGKDNLSFENFKNEFIDLLVKNQ